MSGSSPIPVDPAFQSAGTSSSSSSSVYSYSLSGSSADSCTSSLSSSTFRHVVENGRRYHSFRRGRYLLPNDRQEQERLNLLHHVFRTVFGAAYTAPLATLHPLRKIIDLGTGTGRWAIDTAYEFPGARVTGVDLSPIQPSWVPENCDFEIDDVESAWTVAPGTVDYVHMRCLAGAVRDFPALLAQVLTALRPGGCVEIAEVVATMLPEGEVGGEYRTLLEGAYEKAGVRYGIAGEIAEWLAGAGFVRVTERRARMPLGTWPILPAMKELGRLWKEAVLAGLEAEALAALTREAGWSRQDVDVLVGNLRREVAERGAQRIGRVASWVGWKPL